MDSPIIVENPGDLTPLLQNSNIVLVQPVSMNYEIITLLFKKVRLFIAKIMFFFDHLT
jgi:hypothetical protein